MRVPSLFWAVGFSFVFSLVSSPTLAQAPYTDEAVLRGVNYLTPYGWWGGTYGCGMALSDFDGDGDLDLILTGRTDGVFGIYENDGTGHFLDRTGGIPIVGADYSGLSAADYDADGDLDLYVSHWLAPNVLLRNEGGFVFTDVTAISGPGLADAGAGAGSSWADYDGDGWLDLYLANRTGTNFDTTPSRLFRNLGDGTFESVGALLGVEENCFTFQPVWFDYDRDGDPDLYLSNDKGDATLGCTNRLYENTPNGFIDQSVPSATNVAIDSMGVAVGDFDRNQLSDLYCTNVPTGNPLLMNLGGGVFDDQAFAFGVTSNLSGWGTHFIDYNHDGILDLYVATSTLGDQLFQGQPSAPAVNVASPLGLGQFAESFASAVGDIDGDGDVDIVVQQRLNPIRIFINNRTAPGNWLKVRLHGEWPNLDAIGAAVDVSAPGLATLYQEVRAGVSYKSSSALTLHYGLGAATTVDITVTWPWGGTTLVPGVGANQTVQIFQSETDCDNNGLVDVVEIAAGTATDTNGNWTLDACEDHFRRGDGNGDGSLDVADAVLALHNFTGAIVVDCQRALDSNSDGNVDIADPVYLLQHLFVSGPAPGAPYPACGVAPDFTSESVSCLVPPVVCN